MTATTCALPGLTSDLWIVVDDVQTMSFGLRRAHRWEGSASAAVGHRNDSAPAAAEDRSDEYSFGLLVARCR